MTGLFEDQLQQIFDFRGSFVLRIWQFETEILGTVFGAAEHVSPLFWGKHSEKRGPAQYSLHLVGYFDLLIRLS